MRECFHELEAIAELYYGYDVRALCHSVTEASTLVHGNFSLGNIFLNNGSISCIRSGPEVGMSYPEMDIGWLVGELLKLEIHKIIDRGLFLNLAAILVNGYRSKAQRKVDLNLVMLFFAVSRSTRQTTF